MMELSVSLAVIRETLSININTGIAARTAIIEMYPLNRFKNSVASLYEKVKLDPQDWKNKTRWHMTGMFNFVTHSM